MINKSIIQKLEDAKNKPDGFEVGSIGEEYISVYNNGLEKAISIVKDHFPNLCKEKLGKVQGNIPRTSLDRYGEIAYRTAYNPDYATPWDKLSTLTKRKYKAMAKAILTQAGTDYVE